MGSGANCSGHARSQEVLPEPSAELPSPRRSSKVQESIHTVAIPLTRYSYITSLRCVKLGCGVSAHLVEATFLSLKHAQVGPLTAVPRVNSLLRSTVNAIMKVTHLVTACSLPAVVSEMRCMPVPSIVSTTQFCVRSAWRSFGHAA